MSHIKIELRKEDVDFIKGVCAAFNNDPQELINVLHTCQEHFGYLPAEVQEVVSDELNMPLAKRKTSDKYLSRNSMLRQGR
jgi:NADH-quinone oxidoreductase subunit E/NADP-reducing hydrogenase subunit HndA